MNRADREHEILNGEAVNRAAFLEVERDAERRALFLYEAVRTVMPDTSISNRLRFVADILELER